MLAESLPVQKDWTVLAFRQIIRCHPLYERFTAANAVTEGEPCSMLVNKAQATVQARESLRNLSPAKVHIICIDPNLRTDFCRYALPFLPDYVEVTLSAPDDPS